MRFIPTSFHGVLDYSTGLALIIAPWLLGFSQHGIAAWLPVALGCGAILYSLVTDYELGAFRVLPMPVHLVIDGASGLLLAASPWLFGFADQVWIPHLAFGLFEMAAAAFTNPIPSHAGRSRL